MRYNIDFFVKAAIFERDVKGKNREEIEAHWEDTYMPKISVEKIQKGKFIDDSIRNRKFIKVALDEVFDGIPRPFASPEDAKDTERDSELKRLRAERVALEKDAEIERLREENKKLKAAKKNAGRQKKSGSRTVSDQA